MAVTTAAVIGGGLAIGGAVSDYNSRGDALDAQEDQNAAETQFIKEQAAQARKDAVPLFGAAQQNRELGVQGALDTQGLSTRQQIDTTARGNFFAQEAMLAGQEQTQNALLGLPVDMSGIQPRILHPERNLESMFNTQVPDFVSAGITAPGTEPVQFTPGGTTNQALAAKAYQDGYLTDQQFGALSRNFADDQANAGATNWGSAPNADFLLNKIGANTNPLLSGALSSLFLAVHPGEKPGNQAQLLGGV